MTNSNYYYFTYHSDGIVEERFTKDDNVEDFVDLNLFENGENGDGVDGGDEGREEKGLQDVGRVRTEQTGDPANVEAGSDGQHVPDGADDGHEEDGAQVIEEETVGHEVTGVQNDGRQHEEKEEVRGQGGGSLARGQVQQESDQDADDDQETGLGEDGVELGSHVKT